MLFDLNKQWNKYTVNCSYYGLDIAMRIVLSIFLAILVENMAFILQVSFSRNEELVLFAYEESRFFSTIDRGGKVEFYRSLSASCKNIMQLK